VQPIIPIIRKEAFDDPAYLFELKLDGFRGLANTIQGRMLSKNSNRLRRFERLLDALPPGYVFDGEIVALTGTGGRGSTTCCSTYYRAAHRRDSTIPSWPTLAARA